MTDRLAGHAMSLSVLFIALFAVWGLVDLADALFRMLPTLGAVAFAVAAGAALTGYVLAAAGWLVER